RMSSRRCRIITKRSPASAARICGNRLTESLNLGRHLPQRGEVDGASPFAGELRRVGGLTTSERKGKRPPTRLAGAHAHAARRPPRVGGGDVYSCTGLRMGHLRRIGSIIRPKGFA